MGSKFSIWESRSSKVPQSLTDIESIVMQNRSFEAVDRLNYGDHGLADVVETIRQAIEANQRIALYADYDVDGTMSCVSWIWFLQEIGFDNYVHYIPCRFKEGYGLNLDAVKYLIEEEKADVIITMDTGITANEEAAFCKSRGVKFICTDHHMVQKDQMPDCLILNPKFHPEPIYQELCGCGITFVLLRKLAADFEVSADVWTDLLALAGMATICDVVPLNGVNHQLAKLGVGAISRSKRNVLVTLRKACAITTGVNETDVGFRLGPRINAVGRLEHADKVIGAFIDEKPDELVEYMETCNEKRKKIQAKIFAQACELAERYKKDPVLFLGGDWHPGVVGIAASKLAEKYWKPVWLFNNTGEQCKGSARTVPGFNVTEAMLSFRKLFDKCGGHAAAGGYSFAKGNEQEIREQLNEYARAKMQEQPEIWVSRLPYDCKIPAEFLQLRAMDALDDMRPFGHGFDEPKFLVEAEVVEIKYLNCRTTGEPLHSKILLWNDNGKPIELLFFQCLVEEALLDQKISAVVSLQRNNFRGRESLQLIGYDYAVAADS